MDVQRMVVTTAGAASGGLGFLNHGPFCLRGESRALSGPLQERAWQGPGSPENRGPSGALLAEGHLPVSGPDGVCAPLRISPWTDQPEDAGAKDGLLAGAGVKSRKRLTCHLTVVSPTRMAPDFVREVACSKSMTSRSS
jgi:hypothetical protein